MNNIFWGYFTKHIKTEVETRHDFGKKKGTGNGSFLFIVLSAAQYSQVIRIFDMFTSCYKTLSGPRRNDFIT